ncbi:TcpQ domain-containing protein [Xenorhabdus sp. SGI246]|uniref:TcpQ domain-containing protein n=1 Tax=Xenorhabdus sp. SGI246 TaxID=3158263 RepID=UPI00349F0759
MKLKKGFDMRTKKIILVGLITNALSACSSPPKLSEPEGDWVSFEPVVSQIPSSQIHQSSAVDIMSQPMPATILTTRQGNYSKTSFVTDDGKHIPLYTAVRKIVPVSWGVKLSPDVSQNFRSNVSWTGNDQWPHVLRKMLTSYGLVADISETKKAVFVKYSTQTAAPVTTATGKLLSDKPVILATIGKDGKTRLPPVTPAVTQSTKQITPEIPKPIIKSAPEIKVWKIDKGTSLKKGFESWVSKEKCPTGNGKWNVRWDTDTDYAIDYLLSFSSASFEDATRQLFNLYRKAQAPLYVSGYRHQCLIVISDRK